ncbi:hypothetical protein LLG46_04925 [bacterium]|nr:hypothetical protein [bacterium]
MNQITASRDNGRYVVYASSYAKLNSNVIDGGGTDDTEALQAILDKALEWGGLHLIMDGAALVRGLSVHSNTTIECETRDCGFFLASGSNRSLIQNVNLDKKVRHDKNITLSGGTYNHNCAGQLHHVIPEPDSTIYKDEKWIITMEFYGVEHLTMRDVTIRNQRTFAMLIANWRHVTMENITIDLPDIMHGENQDGIHFWGPGQFLSMRNITGCSGDDFIALAPDEHDSVSDITDVVIDGVYLDNADQGIRLLSRDKGRLDRVIIRNVTGTFKSFGFFINPWFPGASGNFGCITIENVDLRQTKHKYNHTNPFLFRLGGNIEALTLKNINHHNPNEPLCLIEAGIPYYTPVDDPRSEHSHIGTLTIDGLHIDESEVHSTEISHIKLGCRVDNLIIRDTDIRQNQPAHGGCLVETTKQAEIGLLHVSSLTAAGLNTLIHHPEGSIGALCLNDILCTQMEKPLVTGNGKIGNLHANAVFGTQVEQYVQSE